MNWKALLPAAALMILFTPSAAFSRNHHYYGNVTQNGMMNQFGNGAYANHNFNGMAGMNPYAVAPVAPPVANLGAYGISPFANNGFNYAGNNGLLAYNGMNGMCGHHRHKHKRRGVLQALLNQNGYGYGNMGNGVGYGYGNMGYGGYGNGYYGNPYGYGNGLTGGIRNLLNRF